jgi:uncharacterized protein (UPF0335 family)
MKGQDMTEQVTAAELEAFVERIESINGDIAEYTDTRKEIYAELKSRGFCAKTVRKIVALRKKRPDQRAEEEAVEQLYREALGL